MSADEGHKDESTVSAIDSTETATKPTKDRKNRKEKVKPLAKVSISFIQCVIGEPLLAPIVAMFMVLEHFF